jgi:hypothetical protein
MILYQTEQLKETNQSPTTLDIQQVMLDRGLITSYDDKKQIRRLETGEMGEQKVLDLFKEHGLEHWLGLKNLWLDYYGTSECDFILFTRNGCYTFEIKNYYGPFTYKDGICTVNGKTISSNCIDQARKATNKLRNIFQENHHPMPVKSVVLFTGENSQINIESEVNDVKILHLVDLYDYIQEIIREEATQNNPAIHLEKTLHILERHETKSPYSMDSIPTDLMEKVQDGIHCAYCKSYNVNIGRYYVKCSCGLQEPKVEAVIRSICEYGVLNFEAQLTVGEIYSFLAGQITRNFLQKTLATHFKMIKKGKYTYYINLKLPYEKIYHLFTIKLPLYFYTKRGRPIIHMYT